MLRSCYSQSMRYITGDAVTAVQGTWYFADLESKDFPGPHSFGSPTWDTVHPTPTVLGFDATAPRLYYRGNPLNSSDGTQFAGPKDYFLTGQPVAGGIRRGTTGTPAQCLMYPYGLQVAGWASSGIPAKGGKLAGGVAVRAIPPGVPCLACVGVTPLTVTVTLNGFAGIYLPFNGPHVLTQTVIPCRWTVALGGGLSLQMDRGGLYWQLSCLTPLTSAQYLWSVTPPDCVTPGVLIRAFTVIGGGVTCTVSMP